MRTTIMEIPSKLPRLKSSRISSRGKMEKLCLFIYIVQITISFYCFIFIYMFTSLYRIYFLIFSQEKTTVVFKNLLVKKWKKCLRHF